MIYQDVLDEIISGLDPHDKDVGRRIRRAIRRAIVEEVNDLYDEVNELLEETFGEDFAFFDEEDGNNTVE